MIPARFVLLAVPASTWATLPADRPLAEVAKDAAGASRRVAKGSNVLRERVRRAQLSHYIETTALGFWVEGGRRRLTWLYSLRLAFRGLLRLARSAPGAATTRDVFGQEFVDSSSEPVGSYHIELASVVSPNATFHPPSDGLNELTNAYAELTAPALRKLFPIASEEALALYARCAKVRAAFIRRATRANAAVVEVIAQA